MFASRRPFAVPSRSPNAELLAALAAVLRRRRLRWFVFGAQAVAVHGRPRMSEDVDVTVVVDGARVPALVAALERAGFAPRVKDIAPFVARAVVPLVHRRSKVPLDLVVAASGLERDFAARAVPTDLGGVRVPVIAPGDLVVAKIVAGRSKDLEDVASILDAQGPALDVRHVRSLLGELDDALGDTSYLARFDLLAQAR
jgi:hypothetical protein